MHAAGIVARVLDPCLRDLHRKRAAACQRIVLAVVMGSALSLSAIASGVRSAATYRHRIKSVDRLLGNTEFHAMRHALYAAVAARWLSGIGRLLLVIDWSDLNADQRWHCLRASVAVEGRSLTLYEEVHPQAKLNNRQVQERFLKRVAELLPTGCEPIVMTDAGFRSPWFKAVAARGWAFIGRVRGRDLVRQGKAQWTRATALYARASARARDLGRHDYVRKHPLAVRLVLVKLPPRGRHRLNIYGQRRAGANSLKKARGATDPWLLASSTQLDHLAAASIVQLYAQRMRIEQSFRDTKNLRLGQGLNTARSRSRERLQMLLLIGHLASFVQRLIGEEAKARQLQFNFMARPRRLRPEISTLTLARRLLLSTSPGQYLDRLTPWAAIPPLSHQAIRAYASA